MLSVGASLNIIKPASNSIRMTPIISTRVARLHHLDVSANALDAQNHYIPMPKDAREDPARYWITIKVGQALPDAAVLRS